MKIKIFLCGIALFLINSCLAQKLTNKDCVQVFPGSTPTNTTTYTAPITVELAVANSSKYNQIKGSPYLTSTFEKSTIYRNNKALGSYYSRYNAYTKAIEIKKSLDDTTYTILPKDRSTKIVFNTKEIQYLSFEDAKGKQQSDYLIAKTNGKNYRLYRRLKIRYSENQEVQNSFDTGIVKAKFSQFNEYYFQDMTTTSIRHIPAKKSKLLQLFKESDKLLIASLIKTNSLAIKKEDALVKIFDFADTLNKNYAASDK